MGGLGEGRGQGQGFEGGVLKCWPNADAVADLCSLVLQLPGCKENAVKLPVGCLQCEHAH